MNIPAFVATRIATMPITKGGISTEAELAFWAYVGKVLKWTCLVCATLLACIIFHIFNRAPDPNLISQTEVRGEGTFKTVLHDGHWWVSGPRSKYYVPPMVHHADCPCGHGGPAQPLPKK